MKVRQADINRGWGKFCSKSCKAKHQTKFNEKDIYHASNRNRVHSNYSFEEYQDEADEMYWNGKGW